jgi:MFS family permease
LAVLCLFSLGLIAASVSSNIAWFVVYYALITGLGATPLAGSPRDFVGRIYSQKAEKYGLLALAVSTVFGGLTGSLLGGRIASVLSWRWSFVPALMLVPFIVLLVQKIPHVRKNTAITIDWIGGLLSLMGLGSALFGTSLAGEYGWWQPKKPFEVLNIIVPPSTLVSITPLMVLVGIVLLGLFAFWQRQQAQRRAASMLQAGLLSHRPFILGLVTAMLHTLLSTGIQFNLFQFIPAYLELNSFWTAVAISPYSIALLVLIIFTTFKVVGRYPYKLVIHSGLTLFCIGIFQLYRAVDFDMTLWSIMPALVIMGAGSGIFLAQIGVATLANATPDQKAEASGIYTPFQNLGSALGRGILGTILMATASVRIVDQAIPRLSTAVTDAQRQDAIATLTRIIQTYTRAERREFFDTLPATIQPYMDSILNTATIEAMRIATITTLGFGIACLVLSFFLPKRSQPAAKE